MPKVTANNYEMYYEDNNYTDPWKTGVETVWLQHGIGRSTRFWSHWVPPLALQYRVIRRDLRGHGQSADPGPEYQWSVEDLLNDMKGFLDALGLDRVHYLGESAGGILGVAFAVRWPERLKSLTVCASPTSIQPPRDQLFAIGYKNTHEALAQLGPGGWVKALMDLGVISGTSPAHTDWVFQEWSKTPTHVLQGIGRVAGSVDIAPILSQVQVPTLVLAPARSPITPLTEQVMMRDTIPGARITIIDGPGHEIYVDEPDACINALLTFLRSLE